MATASLFLKIKIWGPGGCPPTGELANLHKGILMSKKKKKNEPTTDTGNNMAGSEKHDGEQKSQMKIIM